MQTEFPNAETCRVALYIRLSKEDDNAGPSESVTNQASLLNEFVRSHRLCVYDTYIDDGWSGTSFDRPAFRRMLQDIEEGRVNTVITKDLSRLGRDYIQTGYYMERYFPEKQVRYISLLDGIDTGVECGANDITPFRAIMNDLYARDISRKILSVKHDKQQKGLFIGGKPMYGYRMHPTLKNRIVVDEPAAVTVRSIFAMALSGLSCSRIAAVLNERGVPSPAVYCARRADGRWSAERISEMLRNETYLGTMVQGRTRKISYKTRKSRRLPPENWAVVPGTHEALVSEQDFAAVQQLLQSRRHTRSRKYDCLLKGLVFCRECGAPLSLLHRQNVAGEDVLYFVCRTHSGSAGEPSCLGHTFRVQAVTEAVQQQVRRLLEACPVQMLQSAALTSGERAHSPDRSEDLQRKLTLMQRQLEQMYLDSLSGLLAREDFERLYPRLKAERDALEARLPRMQTRTASPLPDVQALTDGFLQSVCESREALVRLLTRIELTKDRKILLFFRCREP